MTGKLTNLISKFSCLTLQLLKLPSVMCIYSRSKKNIQGKWWPDHWYHWGWNRYLCMYHRFFLLCLPYKHTGQLSSHKRCQEPCQIHRNHTQCIHLTHHCLVTSKIHSCIYRNAFLNRFSEKVSQERVMPLIYHRINILTIDKCNKYRYEQIVGSE